MGGSDKTAATAVEEEERYDCCEERMDAYYRHFRDQAEGTAISQLVRDCVSN